MELNKDEIVDWAVSWALYGLYVQRRKAEKPENHKQIKQKKKSV